MIRFLILSMILAVSDVQVVLAEELKTFRKYHLDIPRSRIEEALSDLASQTGYQLLFSIESADQFFSSPVGGDLTVTEALKLMLEGTGLSGRLTGRGVIVVSTSPPNNSEEGSHEMNKKKGFLANILGLIAASGLSATDEAVGSERKENQVDSKHSILEEIVVRARRRDENLQDVPVSLTAFSTDQIKELQIVTAQDLGSTVPGLTVTQGIGGQRDGNVFTIRGQGQAFGIANPGVVSYFAEVAEAQTTSLFDLQSVQVLKGPQGTLFGRNTTGGAVLMVPNRPTETFEGHLSTKLGNYSLREIEGVFSGPLISDKLLFRAAVQNRVRDGFTKDIVTGTEYDDVDRLNARISFLFRPTESLENYTILYSEKIDENRSGVQIADLLSEDEVLDPANGILPATASLYNDIKSELEAQSARGSKSVRLNGGLFNREVYGVINTMTWNFLADTSLKYIFGYRDAKGNSPSEFDGTYLPVLQNRSVLVDSEDKQSTSHELQISGNSLDNHLDWTFGVFTEKRKDNEIVGVGVSTWVPIPFDLFPLLAPSLGLDPGKSWPSVNNGTETVVVDLFSRGENESQAAYFHGDYHFNEKLSLGLGYRYTRDETESQRYAIPDAAAGLIASAGDKNTGKWSSSVWSTSLQYKLSDDFMLYGAVRKGYRGGGINPSAPIERPDLQSYEPEEVLDFEIGAKTQWMIGGVASRLNLALYHDSYEDIQRSRLVGLASVITNAAEATIQGVDLDLMLQPSEYFDLTFIYTYVDAKYDEWIELDSSGMPVDRSHNEFLDTPEHKYSVIPRFHLPIDPSFGDVTLSAQYSYQGGAYSSDINSADGYVPSYSILNLRADWRNVVGSSLDISLFGTNVSDEKYFISQIAASSIASGIGSVLYGQPRMYGIELNYSF